MRFYRARHCPLVDTGNGCGPRFLEMPELFVWLTSAQANGYGEGVVEAFEDREGEMIPCLVRLDDLYIQEEC